MLELASSSYSWHLSSYSREFQGLCGGSPPTLILDYSAVRWDSADSEVVNRRTCSLRPATLRYPVTIQNGTLTLGDLTNDATVQTFQPVSNSTFGIDGGGDYTWWTLGGFYMAAQSLFNANATYYVGVGEAQIFLFEPVSEAVAPETCLAIPSPNIFLKK